MDIATIRQIIEGARRGAERAEDRIVGLENRTADRIVGQAFHLGTLEEHECDPGPMQLAADTAFADAIASEIANTQARLMVLQFYRDGAKGDTFTIPGP